MDHVYKSQLQAYAQKNYLDVPVYIPEREGPPHACRFRCKVIFHGQTFQSHEFFPTLKAAESAAAKIALASLPSPNVTQEVIDPVYKNLLQEIAQKEGFLLPVYTSVRSGPPHAPTFISTVEFHGTIYNGEEAKTKKLAEMNAAKVAFTTIKAGCAGNPGQTSSPSLPSERQEATNSNVESSVQETLSQPPKMVTPDVPSKWIEVYEDEFPDVFTAPPNPDTEIDKNIAASPVPANPTNDATVEVPTNNAKTLNISASPMPENPTNDGIGIGMETSSSSSVGQKENTLVMGAGYQSIPTGQHVVCRPWNPGMHLPEGAEMLFRDNRFIAYRLLKP